MMMSYEILPALTLFAFVSSITPGPNNLMLMNSGANFGFKLTIPHMLGVGLGFTLMILLVGLGVVELFDRYPLSYDILKVLSIGYLLYLAFKIATSTGSIDQKSSKAKPFTFIQAALFQWVNPKAWTMALTSISLYAPSNSFIAVLLVAIVFGIVNLPCISSWIVLGQKIQIVLTDQKRLRIFNITMALLLIISLYPAL
jgi:threonine/homoserine/homoserine lactone efflux protein